MAPPRAPIGKFGLIGRFFGNTVSEAAAFAAGVALGPVLGPPVELTRQKVWANFAVKVPDVGVLAAGLAQGQIDEKDARPWAKANGFDTAAFDALIAIADGGPGVAAAFELWRRDLIDDAAFGRALKREAIENEWIGPMRSLKRRLLSPAELANAVVQGFRTEPNAAADAALQGYNAADFQTIVDVTGLPPGPETLLDWLRRGIIDPAALDQGIREGHTKIKYIPFYEAARNHVLSATNYVNAAIRGWITTAEMHTGGALTGYDADAMDLLFKIHGRPATTHQVHIGYARGGRNTEVGNDERATFRRAVLESDIRPEWEPILWAQRYSYPAAFVLRALTTAGDITEAQANEILLFQGWEPTLAGQVSASWAGGGGAGAAVDAHVKKAQTSTFTAAHRSYVARESQAGDVAPIMGTLGIDQASQSAILDLWNAERDLIHAELSPTQIRKAVKGAILNRATGQPWTRADALTALLARGYTPADAETFLDE